MAAAPVVAKLVEAIATHIEPKARLQEIQTQFVIDGRVQFIQMEMHQLRLALIAMMNMLLERMTAQEELGLLVRSDATKKHARFVVWSSTHSMLPLEHKKVFEARDKNAKYDLLLAKRLVEKVGGTVALYNGQGRGIAFVIELPWEASAEERNSKPKTPNLPAHPSIIEILLRQHQL